MGGGDKVNRSANGGEHAVELGVSAGSPGSMSDQTIGITVSRSEVGIFLFITLRAG